MRENAKEDIFPNNSFLIDLEGFGVMCLFFFFLNRKNESWKRGKKIIMKNQPRRRSQFRQSLGVLLK